MTAGRAFHFGSHPAAQSQILVDTEMPLEKSL